MRLSADKSAFLFYILYQLHCELCPSSSSSTQPPASFKIIYHHGDAIILFTHIRVSTDMGEILAALSERDSYYLFDAYRAPGSQPFDSITMRAQVIFSHSPSYTEFGEYKKSPYDQLYMPVWDYKELEIVRILSFPHHSVTDFNELYQHWGGTARWTVRMLKSASLAEWQQSIDSLVIDNANKLVGSTGGGVKADISHRILHLFPSEDFTKAVLDFASPLVAKRLFEKFIGDKRNELVQFMLANYNQGEYANSRAFLREILSSST